MTTTRVGIRDLVRNSNELKQYDYVEIEDKKSHELRGVFISPKLAEEFKRYLQERERRVIDEKLEAFESIVNHVETTGNAFMEGYEKDDPKVLQKVKESML